MRMKEVFNELTEENISDENEVQAVILMNTSINYSEHMKWDYWALPIFIVFITGGVFGNFLVCLAISTNRYKE